MINKNDFKYIIKKIIIGLAIAFILFNINKCNAFALVYKTSIYGSVSGGNLLGQLSSGSNRVHNITFSDPIPSNVVNGFDILVIKFGNFSLTTGNGTSVSSSSSFTCNYYQTSSTGDIACSSGGLTTYDNSTSGNIYIQSAIFYDNDLGVKDSCYFSSELQDMIICPMSRKNSNITGMEINIRNGGFGNLTYNITVNGLKYLYNNDSTEIVNGLGGIQQQQQQTNDTLTDSNISGANTDTNNALSGINNSVSNTLDSSINANTLNTLLTGFVNQLSNSTCTPITLPIPFTTENIVLPCLGTEFSQRIPVIWSLYELIITGVIVLRFWQHAVEFILNILDPYHIGANNIPPGGGK